MSKELKPEMWENTLHFLQQIGCESVKNVNWIYEGEGVNKIEVTFEHPIYLTKETK